jgi:hypothetical protein
VRIRFRNWLLKVHVCQFLNWIHRSFRLSFPIECGATSETWRHIPISFKHGVFSLFVICDPHQTTHQSHWDVWRRKVTKPHMCAFDTWRWPPITTWICLYSKTQGLVNLPVCSQNSATNLLLWGQDLQTNYWKCMFVDPLTTYICPPDCLFPIECGATSETQRHSPISFEHMSFGCLLCDPHQTTHQSHREFRWRKVIGPHPCTFDTWRWPPITAKLKLAYF